MVQSTSCIGWLRFGPFFSNLFFSCCSLWRYDKVSAFFFLTVRRGVISGISWFPELFVWAQDNTKSELLGIAAHELRDPIQPVSGLAEMLQSRKNIHPQEQDEFLAIIIRNAKRLKYLTENILDLTKIETQSSSSLNEELVDIKDIMQRSSLDIKSQLRSNRFLTLCNRILHYYL